MTRHNRMILSMILAVMLCVIFSVPSLAFEADEPVPETEPAPAATTEPVPEPTVHVSAPVEIAIISDEDWGSVDREMITAQTYEITDEIINGAGAEPEETAAPADTPAEAEPAAPEITETAATEPETGTGEVPAAEQPAEEVPAEEPAGEEPVEAAPADQPEAEEPAAETIPDEDDEEGELPGEEPEETEPASEPEKPRVTVTVEISMIDDTIMRLLAVVNDPEGRDFLYQWQVSQDGGMTYTDIQEATTEELRVELTDENINDMWRVRVQSI
ncbi:MAG: hypothetical protein IKZ98_12700 [Clostridia bacterium]|nr:hypothetical protein [Clostridia bacterium]